MSGWAHLDRSHSPTQVRGDLRLADLYAPHSWAGKGGVKGGSSGGGGGGGRRRRHRSNIGVRPNPYDPGDVYVQSKIALRQVSAHSLTCVYRRQSPATPSVV